MKSKHFLIFQLFKPKKDICIIMHDYIYHSQDLSNSSWCFTHTLFLLLLHLELSAHVTHLLQLWISCGYTNDLHSPNTAYSHPEFTPDASCNCRALSQSTSDASQLCSYTSFWCGLILICFVKSSICLLVTSKLISISGFLFALRKIPA